jgi:uncharacterized protein YdhG (YjbR/CyaY superfamily)
VEIEMDKMQKAANSIDEYIAQFPADIQKKLLEIRSIIHAAAPNATEKISYQMPTFFLNGNLVHFAAFKNHIGFFPTPSGITSFEEELAPYRTSKGTMQIPLDQPIPADLITRIVKFRLAENRKKLEKKSKK